MHVLINKLTFEFTSCLFNCKFSNCKYSLFKLTSFATLLMYFWFCNRYIKGSKAGHYLSGTISYVKSNDVKKVVRTKMFLFLLPYLFTFFHPQSSIFPHHLHIHTYLYRSFLLDVIAILLL